MSDVEKQLAMLVSANQAILAVLNILIMELRDKPEFNTAKMAVYLQRLIDKPSVDVADRFTYEQLLKSYQTLLTVQPGAKTSAEIYSFPNTQKSPDDPPHL